MNQKTINEIKNKAERKWKSNLAGIVIFGYGVKKKDYRDIRPSDSP